MNRNADPLAGYIPKPLALTRPAQPRLNLPGQTHTAPPQARQLNFLTPPVQFGSGGNIENLPLGYLPLLPHEMSSANFVQKEANFKEQGTAFHNALNQINLERQTRLTGATRQATAPGEHIPVGSSDQGAPLQPARSAPLMKKNIARRELATRDFPRSEAKKKMDLTSLKDVGNQTFEMLYATDFSPENQPAIAPMQEDSTDSSPFIDLHKALKADCDLYELLGVATLTGVQNYPASTSDPVPSVFKPLANVFGGKKTWKINLQEIYLQPMLDKNLLRSGSLATQLAKKLTAEEITGQLASMRLITLLPAKDANAVAFNRDVYHCPPHLLSEENLNQKMLKSRGSAVRSGEEKYRQPSGQVSILLDTLLKCDGDGPAVPVSVVSVAAPALDDKAAVQNAISSRPIKFARPEMQTYIDFTSNQAQPVFIEKNYKTACDTLSMHILEAARLHMQDKTKNPSGRVILCAYGVNAFLAVLRDIDSKYGTAYAKQATTIAAQAFAHTVIELRKMGQEVSFSDASKHGDSGQQFISNEFWDLVDSRLVDQGADKLKPVNNFESQLGKDWVKKGDLIVNAWDPDSLLGNALENDNSFDGHLGRRTTLHLVHALACLLFHGLENKPGTQVKIKLK